MSYGVGGTNLGEIGDYCPRACRQGGSPAWRSRTQNTKSPVVQEGDWGRTSVTSAVLPCNNARQPKTHSHGREGAARGYNIIKTYTTIQKQVFYQ